MNQVTKQIIFTGRVQGVGFRFTAHSIARRYQLKGYVKNVHDGAVEVVVQGPDDLIMACIRDLQDAHIIRETKISEINPQQGYTDFKITF